MILDMSARRLVAERGSLHLVESNRFDEDGFLHRLEHPTDVSSASAVLHQPQQHVLGRAVCVKRGGRERVALTRRVNFHRPADKDDPTIFAWDLINEPRCTGCGWAIQDWVDEMAVRDVCWSARLLN